jgi:predicted phosphoribosyltransferase
MFAVGLWYEHFEPVSDTEVVQVLTDEAARPVGGRR